MAQRISIPKWKRNNSILENYNLPPEWRTGYLQIIQRFFNFWHVPRGLNVIRSRLNGNRMVMAGFVSAGFATALLVIGAVASPQLALADRSSDRRQPEAVNPVGIDAPDCVGEDQKRLSVDNGQVLTWKAKTPNQFKARALVQGEIVRVFPDRNDHNHFEIKIGPNAKDVLEVIYNHAFGDLRDTRVGMTVQACGDYITSIAQSGPYPASPSGAIIHWVHFNPREGAHPHGFVIIDGELFGDDVGKAGRRDSRDGRGNGRSGRHGFIEGAEAVYQATN
jgi:hypothetical protein